MPPARTRSSASWRRIARPPPTASAPARRRHAWRRPAAQTGATVTPEIASHDRGCAAFSCATKTAPIVNLAGGTDEIDLVSSAAGGGRAVRTGAGPGGRAGPRRAGRRARRLLRDLRERGDGG